VLRVVAVAGLMLFLLGFSLRQESRRQQLMELVGYWVAEDIRENRHSFFPDDSAAYVPWHTDDGGRLKGVSFREDGEAYVSLRYEKNGFSENEWVLGGRFARYNDRLVIRLYRGIDRAVCCRYFALRVEGDRLILRKAYREDGMWLPIYVDEHLVRYE
jgi:hypothetical protein